MKRITLLLIVLSLTSCADLLGMVGSEYMKNPKTSEVRDCSNPDSLGQMIKNPECVKVLKTQGWYKLN